jgi:hypothetical protein
MSTIAATTLPTISIPMTNRLISIPPRSGRLSLRLRATQGPPTTEVALARMAPRYDAADGEDRLHRGGRDEATYTRDRDEWIAGLKLGEEGAVLTGSKDPERTGFGE